MLHVVFVLIQCLSKRPHCKVFDSHFQMLRFSTKRVILQPCIVIGVILFDCLLHMIFGKIASKHFSRIHITNITQIATNAIKNKASIPRVKKLLFKFSEEKACGFLRM